MLFNKSIFFKKLKELKELIKSKEIGLSVIQFVIISLLVLVKR